MMRDILEQIRKLDNSPSQERAIKSIIAGLNKEFGNLRNSSSITIFADYLNDALPSPTDYPYSQSMIDKLEEKGVIGRFYANHIKQGMVWDLNEAEKQHLLQAEEHLLNELKLAIIARFHYKKISELSSFQLDSHDAEKLLSHIPLIESHLTLLASNPKNIHVEAALLACIQLGEFLEKIYPGQDSQQIETELEKFKAHLFPLDPDEATDSTMASIRRGLIDIVGSEPAKAAIRGLEGFKCLRYNKNPSSAEEKKSVPIDDDPRIAATAASIQSLIEKKIINYQHIIDGINDQTQTLNSHARIEIKTLALALRGVLNKHCPIIRHSTLQDHIKLIKKFGEIVCKSTTEKLHKSTIERASKQKIIADILRESEVSETIKQEITHEFNLAITLKEALDSYSRLRSTDRNPKTLIQTLENIVDDSKIRKKNKQRNMIKIAKDFGKIIRLSTMTKTSKQKIMTEILQESRIPQAIKQEIIGEFNLVVELEGALKDYDDLDDIDKDLQALIKTLSNIVRSSQMEEVDKQRIVKKIVNDSDKVSMDSKPEIIKALTSSADIDSKRSQQESMSDDQDSMIPSIAGSGITIDNSDNSADENNTSTLKQTNNPLSQSIWIYIARPLLVAGFFLTLGFTIFISSLGFGLAMPGEILMTGGLASSTALILATIALSLITNLVIQWLKPSVADVLPCQVITSAEDAIKILARLKTDSENASLRQALRMHIEDAINLLDPTNCWQNSLITYHNNDSLTPKGNGLAILKRHIPRVDVEDIDELAAVFRNLQNATIDPTYKPPRSIKKSVSLILLSFLAAILFTSCIITLSYIFTQGATFGLLTEGTALAPWLLVLAAFSGFASWSITRYVLNNTSGGVYAELAAISGIAFIAVIVLSSFAAISPLTLLLGVPCGFFFWLTAKYIISDKDQRNTTRKQWVYKASDLLLTTIKVTAMLGFLFLAFLSITVIFNLGALTGLGGTYGLLGFAFDTIAIALGYGGFEVGAQWLSVFCIAIFSISSFIAFELFKNFLEKSPTTANNFKKYQHFILLGTLLLKLTFTTGIIVTLMAMPSFFLPEATISLFPIFLIIALVMPIFSGNANLPFLEGFNKFFNRNFGVQPFIGGYKEKDYLRREIIVSVILACLLFFAYLPGVPTTTALTVLGIGISITMALRWVTMWQYAHNPKILAENYLRSAKNKVAINNLETVQMHIQYSPLQSDSAFGHVRTNFKSDSSNLNHTLSWSQDGGYYGPHGAIPGADENYTSIAVPFKLTGKNFQSINNYIDERLDTRFYPNTFLHKKNLYKDYSLRNNNCAHVSLIVIVAALKNHIEKIPRKLKSGYSTQLKKLQDLLTTETILTPRTMFVRTCDIFLEINRLERAKGPGPYDHKETFYLENDMARLDLKIAKAQAGRFALSIPEGDDNNEFLKKLKRLQAEKEKALELLHPNKKPVVLEESKRLRSSSLESTGEEEREEYKKPRLVRLKTKYQNENIGLEVFNKSAEKQQDSADAQSPQKIPQAHQKSSLKAFLEFLFEKLVIKGIGWKGLVSLLTLLVVLCLPAAGQAFLSTKLILAFFIMQASLALLGLPVLLWRAYKEWAFYNAQQRVEWSLLVAGLIGLAVVSAIVMIEPASVIFSTTFVLPLLSITAMLVAYFFSKHGLAPSAIETTWQLLARTRANDKGEIEGEIENILDQLNPNSPSLNDKDKQLLLRFLDVAIQAMEKELIENEKNSDKLTVWIDRTDRAKTNKDEIGGSLLFTQDLKRLQDFRAALNDSNNILPQFPASNTDIPAICDRLKTCQMSPDINSARKKIAIVLLALLFIGVATISGLFVLNIRDIAVAFDNEAIARWIFMGLTITFIGIKAVTEWARQRAISYDEFTGKTQRPSQRITAERLVVWLANFALVALTIVAGFVLGITSTAFLSMTLITTAWYIGQTFASTSFQGWLRGKHQSQQDVEKPDLLLGEKSLNENDDPREKKYDISEKKSSLEDVQIEINDDRDDSLLVQDEDLELTPEESKRDLSSTFGDVHSQLNNSLLPLERKHVPDPTRSARSYFNIEKPAGGAAIPLADLTMRSYFVSAAVLATIGHEVFSHSIYNTMWNFVDGLGSYPGIVANVKNNWQEADAWEKSLTVFETTVASFLVTVNVLSTIAQQNADTFEQDNAVMATLSGYGFALSMMASAMRAMKDTWTAWNELSPRYLLEDRLEKCRRIQRKIDAIGNPEDAASNKLMQEKTALLNEALAIARVKRNEILEDEETRESIFLHYLRDDNSEELNAPPTEEEKLFVETLLKTNEEKFQAAFVNFLGYLAATICFWLLALNPVVAGGITLLSYGGGTHLFLIIGGVIKFGQIAASLKLPYDWYQPQKMRDAFLDHLLTGIDRTIDEAPLQDKKAYSEKFTEFFDQHNEINAREKAKYKIAYAIRKKALGDDQIDLPTFLQRIYADPKKDALLDAALDEFIILANNSPIDENKKENIFKVLQALMIDDLGLKKTRLQHNVEFREKAVVSIGKSLFFSGGSLPVREENEIKPNGKFKIEPLIVV